ncbi:class I SAM-dependent methyltransferase [Paenibacillus wynnii]|uniref:class I SAM-dependent methyltransferase n=1 Tax=Paenibacillus wynnii TaxID=268407 RepID=UPI00278CDE54|nr:class I SAM-dependent methyltransferase [Paenibacillus wynnii]MDQ0195583.1 ubiquinone/menaquinone biosynthesis C-methylase UbiE [Paenibacillus wynnii]
MSNIVDFYSTYDEDSRLQSNNARRLEFITTTTILNEYMKPSDRVLEVGAGTGVYSMYYAERGYEVTATDLTPKHIQIIESKLKNSAPLRMNAKVADATNLSEFTSETFDVVLCLGPMYHLIDREAQEKCISECLRVLKPGGILAIAYITKYSVFPYLVKGDRKFLDESWVDRILDKGFTSSNEEDCFWTDAYFHAPEELEQMMFSTPTEKLTHAASDGISPLISPIVDGLSPEEFEVWTKYHLRTCKEPSILGTSSHALYVCTKK